MTAIPLICLLAFIFCVVVFFWVCMPKGHDPYMYGIGRPDPRGRMGSFERDGEPPPPPEPTPAPPRPAPPKVQGGSICGLCNTSTSRHSQAEQDCCDVMAEIQELLD